MLRGRNERKPGPGLWAWLAGTPAAWPEAAWDAAHRAFIDVLAFAEGPIDVDRQVDWDLANRIVRSREAT